MADEFTNWPAHRNPRRHRTLRAWQAGWPVCVAACAAIGDRLLDGTLAAHRALTVAQAGELAEATRPALVAASVRATLVGELAAAVLDGAGRLHHGWASRDPTPPREGLAGGDARLLAAANPCVGVAGSGVAHVSLRWSRGATGEVYLQDHRGAVTQARAGWVGPPGGGAVDHAAAPAAAHAACPGAA